MAVHPSRIQGVFRLIELIPGSALLHTGGWSLLADTVGFRV